MTASATPRSGTDEIRAELLLRLPALPEIAAIEPMAKARGYPSWRVRFRDPLARDLVFKRARIPAEIARLGTQAEMTARARAGGVPAPAVLGVFEGGSEGALPWMALEFLPGDDAEDAWPSLSPAEREQALRELGRAVARLHLCESEAFTEGKAPRPLARSWAAHVADRARKLETYHRRAGVLAAEEVREAAARVTRLADRASPAVRPALTHRDLFLANVVVHERRLAGLLDFEHARWSDPEMDFVKLAMWVFERHPGSEDRFLEGYRAIRPDPGGFAPERRAISWGLELLGGIPFHHRARQQAELEDYLRRFRSWLRSTA